MKSDERLSRSARSISVEEPTVSDELLELMADKFRMLSDPTRLAILRSLMTRGEMNVSELVIASGRSVANVSKHLKLLADAGLLSRQKQGSFVLYRLDDPLIAKMCELVCDSLKREFQMQLQRNRRLLQKPSRD